jgi:hypothetical protein
MLRRDQSPRRLPVGIGAGDEASCIGRPWPGSCRGVTESAVMAGAFQHALGAGLGNVALEVEEEQVPEAGPAAGRDRCLVIGARRRRGPGSAVGRLPLVGGDRKTFSDVPGRDAGSDDGRMAGEALQRKFSTRIPRRTTRPWASAVSVAWSTAAQSARRRRRRCASPSAVSKTVTAADAVSNDCRKGGALFCACARQDAGQDDTGTSVRQARAWSFRHVSFIQ